MSTDVIGALVIAAVTLGLAGYCCVVAFYEYADRRVTEMVEHVVGPPPFVDYLFDAPEFSDCPIFDLLDRERFERDALAEIEHMTGGAS